MINKNTFIILVGSLVFILGISGYILYSRNKTLAINDDTTSIENDLNNTDLNNIDKESVDIQTELNSTN